MNREGLGKLPHSGKDEIPIYGVLTANRRSIILKSIGGVLHAFGFKYATNKQAAIPFSTTYPEHSFTLIDPDSFHQLFD
jgi:hypothetical protein